MSLDLDNLDARKKAANSSLTMGNFESALESYEAIVKEIDDSMEGDLHDDAAISMKISCLNNLAMAHLKLDRYEDCIETCTKALVMDAGNLKAYYRRSLSYMEIAKREDEAKDFPNSSSEVWTSSEFWDKADVDANSILEKESENKQGKNLKADIRRTKIDLETKSKYNMKMNTMGDTKNSVFKGFPREVPAISEQDITNHIQKQQKEEQERAAAANLEEYQKQQAESYSKSPGYVFLDPNWTPEMVPSTDVSTHGTVAGVKEASSGTVTKTPTCSNTKKPSFKDLLRKARDVKMDTKKTSSQGVGENSKKLAETEAVKGALDDLKSTEDIAKERVLSTYTMKDVIGSTRAKGSDKVKERLGFKDAEKKKLNQDGTNAALSKPRSELKDAGECDGVWAELEMEEKMAITRVKKLVHDRNQV